MTDRPNDRVDDAVDQYLRYLEEGTTRPSLADLTDVERRQAEAILHLLEDCWGAEAPVVPPLENDAIAIELGLVPGQPKTVTIDGHLAKRFRLDRNLQLQQVADVLIKHDRTKTLHWALQMELSDATQVEQAMAEDLAKLLGVPLAQIISKSPGSSDEGFSWYFRTKRFAAQVANWARARGLDPAGERLRVERSLTMAPRRSHGRVSEDECSRLVDAYFRTRTP